jgi:hypothetical protein
VAVGAHIILLSSNSTLMQAWFANKYLTRSWLNLFSHLVPNPSFGQFYILFSS